jgi:hypothetical protein
MGVEMTEVAPAVVVEPQLSVSTFPLGVAKGVLPIVGEVEYVRQELARLLTYRREEKKKESAHKVSR